MADTTRDIELRLRARDLSNAELTQVIQKVNELSGALDKQLAAATRLEIKERELKNTLQQFNDAAKNITGLDATIQRYKAINEQVERNAAQLEQAKSALAAHQAAMAAGTATGTAAERSLKGFESAVNAAEKRLQTNNVQLERYRTSLEQAGVSTSNLVAAEQQLIDTATQIGNARTRLNETISQYPELERRAIAAIRERQEAERKAAAELATSIRLQEQKQLRDFKDHQAFKERTAEAVRLSRQRYDDEVARARQAINDIRNAQQQRATVQQVPVPTQHLAGSAATSAALTGPFGLRPYAATNLAYQVNDVISGIASGQPILQIFAQQIGQIAQIFPRFQQAMVTALRFFPLFAAGAAAAAVAIGAINRNLREAASSRDFEALLSGTSQAATQSVPALNALRKELRDLGVDWDDAGKVIRQILNARVLPESRDQFAKLAEAIAKVEQKDISEVTTNLISGFQGGREGFEKLLVLFPKLDDDLVRQIRRLYELGRANEAQKLALNGWANAYDEARKKSVGPFEEETKKLSKAWDDFLVTLGKGGAIKTVVDYLSSALKAIGDMISTIQAASNLIDAIDKKYPWLKYVALGPAGLAKGAADLAAGALGGGPDTVPPGTKIPLGSGIWTTFPQGNIVDTVRSYFTRKGYSPEAIAGIMGNIQVESSFNTGARNATGHFGLVQWDKTRQAPLGGSTDVVRQLDLINSELESLDPNFKKAAQSAEQAALRFEKVFERSGGQLNNLRVANARAFYNANATNGIGIDATQPYVVGTGGGGVIGPDKDRLEQLQRENRLLKEQVDLRTAQTRKEEEQKFIAIARREAEEKITATGTEQEIAAAKKAQDDYVSQKLAERRLQIDAQDYEREQARAALRAKDKPGDTARAEAAGQKAVSDFLKDHQASYEQIEAIRDKGAADERARIAKEREDREALQQLRKTFANDLRTLELKHASDLAQALDVVNEKYRQRIEAIDKLKDHSKDLSETELADLKASVEYLRQREEVEARVTAARKSANEALSARGDAVRTINRLEELGEITLQQKEDQTKKLYADSRSSILGVADALEGMIGKLKEAGASDTEIAKLTNQVKLLRAEAKYVDPFWKGLKETFQTSFSTAGSQFFDNISEAIGGAIAKTKEWKDVWQGLKNAAANFFAQILKDLANYIIKAQLAKLASSLLGGTSFGNLLGIGGSAASTAATTAATAGTSAAATTSTGIFGLGILGLHGGGVVGRRPISGQAPASWWANAPRYHSGSIVGLAPDEQAAILKRGEEVLAADSPRNILNGGGMGGVSIRNVLVDDRARIPEAMAGAHGERVVIQHLVRNAATVREIIR